MDNTNEEKKDVNVTTSEEQTVNLNFRIIFKPQGSYDEHDLSTITDCIIIDIEDYH